MNIGSLSDKSLSFPQRCLLSPELLRKLFPLSSPCSCAEPQSRLRLGSTAPNFKAETTTGQIDFHEWIGDKWAILFSHPEDYTPVCTTELAALAKYEPEFTKRGVKLIGLSTNTVETHGGWINDIDELSGSTLSFPIIGDKDRQIAFAYDM